VALRAGDIDVVMVNGYGFPRWRGGPLFAATLTGLDRVLADVEGFAGTDAVFWAPAPGLAAAAARGSFGG
jgi:3-hydroxyacyl-CoA dehydrogenase